MKHHMINIVDHMIFLSTFAPGAPSNPCGPGAPIGPYGNTTITAILLLL